MILTLVPFAARAGKFDVIDLQCILSSFTTGMQPGLALAGASEARKRHERPQMQLISRAAGGAEADR
jgi:hypothetical protein